MGTDLQCVIYAEEITGVNMTGSKGLVTLQLGSGTRTYGSGNLKNVFDNSTASYACQAGGTYTPSANDNRRIIVQFNDGTGVQTLPASDLTAVPYSMQSYNTQRLGNSLATDFLKFTDFTGTCAAGEYLKYDSTASPKFSCATPTGTGAGIVMSVAPGTGPLLVGGTATDPTISIPQASGTTDGYLSSADFTTFNSKLSNFSTLSSSDISAKYGYVPASASNSRFSDTRTPTDGSVTAAKIASAAITFDKFNQSSASTGQVIKWNGSAWVASSDETGAGGTVTNVSASGPLSSSGGAAPNITLARSNGTTDGYLSSTDFTIFSNKLSDFSSLLSSDITGKLGYTPVNPATAVTSVAGRTGVVTLSSSDITGLAFGTTVGTYAQGNDSRFTDQRNPINDSVTSAKILDGAITSSDISTAAVTFDKLNQSSATSGQVIKWNGSAWVASSDDTGAGGTVTNVSASGPLSSTGGETPNITIAKANGTTDGYLSSADWTTFSAKLSDFSSLLSSDVTSKLGFTPLNPANNLSDITSSDASLNNLLPTQSASSVLQSNGTKTSWLLFNTSSSINSLVQRDSSGVMSSYGVALSGATSGNVTLQSPSITTSYNLTLPNVQGGSNQVLVNNGSGLLSWVTPLTSFSSITSGDIAAGSGFVNGGNSFGSAANLGTNDNQDLNLKTNGSTKMTVLANGNVGIGTTSPAQRLDVQGTIAASSISNDSTAFSLNNLAVNNIWNIHNLPSTDGSSPKGLMFENCDNGPCERKMTIMATGHTGLGVTVPTGKLHISASDGSASSAPLKLSAGTNLVTPEDGAMEFDGTNLYFTSSGARRTIASSSGGALGGNISAINNTGGSIALTPSVGNSVIVNQTTSSTNSSSGALIVNGGAGIAENLNVGGNIVGSGTITAQTSMLSPLLYGSSASSGDLTLDSTSHGTKGNIILAPNGGNVGIGISSPIAKFESNRNFTGEINTIGAFIGGHDVTSDRIGVYVNQKNSVGLTDTGSLLLNVVQSDVSQFSVNGAGGVNIGASSILATEKLAIQPGSGKGVRIGPIGNDGSTSLFVQSSTSSQSAGVFRGYLSQSAPILSVQNSVPVPLFEVHANGNVGIDILSPAQKLDVNGGIKAAYGEPTGVNLNSSGFSFDGDTGLFAASDGELSLWSDNVKSMTINNGRIGIGTNQQVSLLEVVGEGVVAGQKISSYRNDGIGSYLWGQTSRGTAAVPTALNSGDVALTIAGNAHNGTGFGNVASMNMVADGSQTLTSFPGALVFSTTSSGDTANTERVRINSLGNVGIGTTTPIAKLDVNGSIRANNHLTHLPWYNSGPAPQGSWVLGYFKLKTSIHKNEENMFLIKIHGYRYGLGGAPFEIKCSGYAYGATTLISNRCHTDGISDPVAIGVDTDDTVMITIGSTAAGSLWYYDQFSVEYSGWKPKTPESFTWEWNYNSNPSIASQNNVVVDDVIGAIGIGTAAPSKQLEINADANVGARGIRLSQPSNGINLDISTSGGGNSFIGTTTNDDFNIFTNGTSKIKVTASGRVGIGTTSPTAKLDIISGADGVGSDTGLMIRASDYVTNGGYLYINRNSGASSSAILQAGDNVIHNTLSLNPNGGNVGIGTTNPSRNLTVQGDGRFYTGGGQAFVEFENGSAKKAYVGVSADGGLTTGITTGDTVLRAQGSTNLHLSTDSASKLTLTSGGNVGVGITTPGYKLDVQGGGVNASGGYTQTSDIRLKTNIEYLDSKNMLEKISTLHGINYNWKDQEKNGSELQIGLVAQDVEKVFPQAVKKNSEGFLSVSYSNLVAPVIESIKELFKTTEKQSRQLASIEERLSQLDQINKKLLNENNELKKVVCAQNKNRKYCR